MAKIQLNETEKIDVAAYLLMKGFKVNEVKKSQKTPYKKVFVFESAQPHDEIKKAQIEYLNTDFHKFADNMAHFKNLIHIK